jgi:hypothetical protein
MNADAPERVAGRGYPHRRSVDDRPKIRFTTEHTARQSRNRRADGRASEGILKPQMNADERRWIEVSATGLPDQATTAFVFDGLARLTDKVLDALDLPARLGTSAFICVHLRFQTSFGAPDARIEVW